MKKLAFAVAAASLLACLAVPVLHFAGTISMAQYKLLFLLASIAWFISATWWAVRGGRAERREAAP